MKDWDEKQQILKMVLYQNFLFQNQSLHLSPFFTFLGCTINIVQHKQGKNFEK